MKSAFIVDAVRTPIGRHKGALASVRPDDLASFPLRALVERTKLDPAKIDHVILGCANQAGEDNRNVARMALLLADLPDFIPAVTVNRLCGSGLEAIAQATRLVRLGEADVVLAGGVESMTRAPWSLPKPDGPFPTGKLEAFDTSLGWRYPNPRLAARFPLEQMGETAENLRETHDIPREEQDALALASHQNALLAWEKNLFDAEVIPVPVVGAKGETKMFTRDEGPRADTSLEKLAKLRAVFREGGTVTAGNSSTLNDGAAAVLVASERALKELSLQPLARWVADGAAGVNPRTMGLGPIPATRKALERAGMKSSDIDLWELNEAFAIQVLACARELEIPRDRLNVNGGGIALGHPLGSSGARILTTLVHEMKRRGANRGVATMCIGVGQGIAAILEAA